MKKIMTRLLVATTFVSILFSFSSCDKLKSQVHLPDVFAKSKDIEFDIPPTAVGTQYQNADVSFDVNALLAANNTSGYTLSASNVKSATVSKVSVDITSTVSTSNNFANFVAGGLAIYSNAAPTQVNVAQVQNNPDVYSTHLDFTETGTTDISGLLKGSTITYLFGYTLRRPTTVTLHVVLHVEYDIQLSL
ncbi:MAG TPA: hypothetical protein VIM07_14405 [Chitinophagaceae bacterium]